MNDEQLILLVQANECLYNKCCPGYKLAEKKLNVWKQISIEMQVPQELCIKRWACLRDRYAREKRQESLPSGSGLKLKCQWPLLQAMEFIAPHIVPRAMRCSYNIIEEDVSPLTIDTFSQSSSSQSQVASPLAEQSPQAPQNLPSPAMQKRKRKLEIDEDKSYSAALGAFKKLCENKIQKETEEEKDPLHGFGKMIVAIIGSMSSRKQTIAMQRVTAMVMEIKLEPDD